MSGLSRRSGSLGGARRVVAIERIHAESQGKRVDEMNVNVFVVNDGLVHEVIEFSRDTAKNDEFCA